MGWSVYKDFWIVIWSEGPYQTTIRFLFNLYGLTLYKLNIFIAINLYGLTYTNYKLYNQQCRNEICVVDYVPEECYEL